MTTRMIRLWPALFFSGILVCATGPTVLAQDTIVTVTFSGKGTGVYTGQNFSGTFTYDQALKVNPLKPGEFDFKDSGLQHQVCYTLDSHAQVCAVPPGCEPFTI